MEKLNLNQHKASATGMTIESVQEYLSEHEKHLHIVKHRDKHNHKKVSWHLGFAGITLDESYVSGMEFTLLKRPDEALSLSNLLIAIKKATPTLAEMDVLVLFHDKAHKETIEELSTYESGTHDFKRTERFAQNGKKYIKIIANIKEILTNK
jgi:hypothetical protein